MGSIWFFPVMRLPGLGAQRIRHVQYRPIVSPPRPQRPAPATPAALCPLVHGHIAGKAKSVMANDASCRWDGDLAPGAKLVSHFNSVYPQATSWRLLTLNHAMHSAVLGGLSHQPSLVLTNLFILDATLPPLPGACGTVSAPPQAYAPSCRISSRRPHPNSAPLCPAVSHRTHCARQQAGSLSNGGRGCHAPRGTDVHPGGAVDPA
ncbi:hypothetical protein MHU86_21324 [Fragilaria crotonensis]|nr:hypothetical protein MHU86_21324 [Fragilaria crotonensis]